MIDIKEMEKLQEKFEQMTPTCQMLFKEIEILKAMVDGAMFQDQRQYYTKALNKAVNFFNQMYYGVKW